MLRNWAGAEPFHLPNVLQQEAMHMSIVIWPRNLFSWDSCVDPLPALFECIMQNALEKPGHAIKLFV
jgi:hypothetical protein